MQKSLEEMYSLEEILIDDITQELNAKELALIHLVLVLSFIHKLRFTTYPTYGAFSLGHKYTAICLSRARRSTAVFVSVPAGHDEKSNRYGDGSRTVLTIMSNITDILTHHIRFIHLLTCCNLDSIVEKI